MNKASINKILNDKKTTHCYIYKGGYYRPNSCGYTDRVTRAGVYTKEDAIRHHEHCDSLKLIPINNSEHNNLILDEIKELLTRIIN